MYQIIPAQLDWFFSTFTELESTEGIVPEDGLFLNPYFPLDGSQAPFRGFSNESSIIAAHTRKPIGVVSGRHMGLFRNNTRIHYRNNPQKLSRYLIGYRNNIFHQAWNS